jgi:hypothetical protein
MNILPDLDMCVGFGGDWTEEGSINDSDNFWF